MLAKRHNLQKIISGVLAITMMANSSIFVQAETVTSHFEVGAEDMSDAGVTISVPEKVECEYYVRNDIESYIGNEKINAYGKLDAYDKELVITIPSSIKLNHESDGSSVIAHMQLLQSENMYEYDSADNSAEFSFEDLYNYVYYSTVKNLKNNPEQHMATTLIKSKILYTSMSDVHIGTYSGTMTYNISTRLDENKSDYYSTGLGTYIDGIFYPYTDQTILRRNNRTTQTLSPDSTIDMTDYGNCWSICGNQANINEALIYDSTTSNIANLGDVKVTVGSYVTNLNKVIIPYGVKTVDSESIGIYDKRGLSLYLPHSVENLGVKLFENVGFFTPVNYNIYYDGTEKEFMDALLCRSLYNVSEKNWKYNTRNIKNIFTNKNNVSHFCTDATVYVRNGNGEWKTFDAATVVNNILAGYGGSITSIPTGMAESVKTDDMSAYY